MSASVQYDHKADESAACDVHRPVQLAYLCAVDIPTNRCSVCIYDADGITESEDPYALVSQHI